MKKFIALFLSFMLLCGVLCACTPSSTDNNKDNNNTAPKGYEIGTLTTNSWQSSWIGLQYKADSSMVMATQQDMENMMNLGADVMFGENGQQMVDWAKVTTAYEMMATNASNGSNVIVCAEKLTLSNITVSQYLDALKTQTTSLGLYTNINFSTPVTQKVGGIDFTRTDMTATFNGAVINQTYMVAKMEDRMVSLIFTCTASGALETMLAGFSAYSG